MLTPKAVDVFLQCFFSFFTYWISLKRSRTRFQLVETLTKNTKYHLKNYPSSCHQRCPLAERNENKLCLNFFFFPTYSFIPLRLWKFSFLLQYLEQKVTSLLRPNVAMIAGRQESFFFFFKSLIIQFLKLCDDRATLTCGFLCAKLKCKVETD